MKLFTLTPIAARRVCFARFDNRTLGSMGLGFRRADEGLLDRVFDRSLRSLPRGGAVETDGVTEVFLCIATCAVEYKVDDAEAFVSGSGALGTCEFGERFET